MKRVEEKTVTDVPSGVVTPEDVKVINDKLLEAEASAAAKGAAEVAAEVGKSLEELKAELAKVKEANAKAAEESEKARILAELELERKRALQAQEAAARKHVVDDAKNPVVTGSPASQAVKPTPEMEWEAYERAVRGGGFSATYKEQ